MPVFLQLGLITLVVRQFEIESTAFFHLTVLALTGFLIHSCLPFVLRLPFFLALSLAGLALVLGPRPAASIVIIGCGLVGLCHLPFTIRVRVVLLLLAGGLLAVLRTGQVAAPLSPIIWPILGSMFMFRLCIYLYDISHSNERPRPVHALSYFFLLPNVCFPLFPIVDYQTFGRAYYNDNPLRIYQRGIDWMFRGVVHLILYRLLYHYVAITPGDVTDVSDLVRFLVANYGLYLRVSGQFHLIIGMLHLFGFNLPPTHHLYFLASSFTDLWRRINIYWKDFMMKMFYYPAVFSLKRFGTLPAIVASTLLIFLLTWLLHSYQWFWLRGSFPLLWHEGLFWAILAVLVTATTVRETTRGRKRTLANTAPASWSGNLKLALRTAATFFGMCVLWSLWMSESFTEWTSMWSAAFRTRPTFAGEWQILFIAAAWIGVTTGAKTARLPDFLTRTIKAIRAFRQSALGTGVMILGIYVAGQPAVYGQLGSTASDVVTVVRSAGLNARDNSQLERGYYESLIRVDRFNSQLWEVYMRNPVDVNEWGEVGRTVRFTQDFRLKELRPDLRTSLKNQAFSTNRWGLRDLNYEEVPSPGTWRVALLGSSVVVGSGVADGENFESIVESRLNREDIGADRNRYEILNFAVGGYGPLEQVVVLEKKVLSLQPSVALYAAHDSDEERAVAHLARAVFRGVSIPYSELSAIASVAAGASSEAAAEARLKPFGREIVSWAYRQIASQCIANAIQPAWMFLPVVHKDRTKIGYLGELAEQAGFRVFDFSDAFAAHDLDRLKVSDVDYHPNREGHRVLADRLYQVLREPIFLSNSSQAATGATVSRR